ncbi:hypothetical protein HZH68_000062 [Vespula germanica]|uniref:Uncharacterized protein n=1 Tax=Vespula germanica TaxID=30212 RepID=A0A834U5D3_VESGE|nr:hypothetical protein HZH68_000062 [Vespula germanica]
MQRVRRHTSRSRNGSGSGSGSRSDGRRGHVHCVHAERARSMYERMHKGPEPRSMSETSHLPTDVASSDQDPRAYVSFQRGPSSRDSVPPRLMPGARASSPLLAFAHLSLAHSRPNLRRKILRRRTLRVVNLKTRPTVAVVVVVVVVRRSLKVARTIVISLLDEEDGARGSGSR